MERKKFCDGIYEDIIADDISERYDCMITFWITKILFRSIILSISQTNTLGCVAKRLLPKDCHALFPVSTKGDSNCLCNSISLLLTREQSQLSTELQIKVVGEMVKNRSLHDAGNFLKHGADNFDEDMLDSMRMKHIAAFVICMHWLMLSAVT